jgi:putative protein kinase ArgK-like GTPase of G3E family
MEGISEVLDGVKDFYRKACLGDCIRRKRAHQAVHWMHAHLMDLIQSKLNSDIHTQHVALGLSEKLKVGEITPRRAAKNLYETFMDSIKRSMQ